LNIRIKLFADGASLHDMRELARDPRVKGFTTNPTLMRKAGVSDYRKFAREVLDIISDRPVSFEVFADEPDEMLDQARAIASWGNNVNIKIPVTNTKGESTAQVVRTLSREGIVLNVTAIMTVDQVREVAEALCPDVPAIVSVFAGRIADTGVDPVPHMMVCRQCLEHRPKAELLWASPRELLNIFHAQEAGCHIITATPDVLAKLALLGKDLREYSLETVRMFHRDALESGFEIKPLAIK
jgi:transaldolase